MLVLLQVVLSINFVFEQYFNILGNRLTVYAFFEN